MSARPGKWKNSIAPYLAGIMDAATDPTIEELVIRKAAQLGMSEAMRNLVGYFAHTDPDPVMLVLPDEHTGRKIIAQRVIPLLRDTPCLRELFTPQSRDVQLRHIALANGFTLRLAWAGSPASLAADPCRVVILDEVDKYRMFATAREADPISLAYVRTQTYEGRRLVICLSTPTLSSGLISERYESCQSRMRFVVPCHQCGAFQELVFGRVKWPERPPDRTHAEWSTIVERDKSAWYECEHCRAAWSDVQRIGSLRRGRWIFDSQTITPTGVVVGERRPGARVGVHLWAGHATWIPLHRIAGEWLRSQGDHERLRNCVNSWLGEPFKEQVTRAKPEAIEAKESAKLPAGVLPAWAQRVIATADTQADHFWYVVRAWGAGFRSQLLDFGIAFTFDELRARALNSHWTGEGRTLGVAMLGIDSGGTGDRTSQVYKFALTDPSRIRAMKGNTRMMDVPLSTKRVTYRPPMKTEAPFPVFLTIVNPSHYKDRLAYAMTARLALENGADVEQWGICDRVNQDYLRQMASEHKVLMQRGRRQVESWELVTAGTPNHLWDCETAQFACADMERIDLLRELSDKPKPAQTPQPERQSQAYRPAIPPRGQFRRRY